MAGKWKKGGPSPNPGGRPKEVREVTALARQLSEVAIKVLAKIAIEGKNEGARVRAAEVLLDRGWGKAPQEVKIEDVTKRPTDQLLAALPEALRVLGVSK
jgi:hypothetical protein